jgi:hypothetical protein
MTDAETASGSESESESKVVTAEPQPHSKRRKNVSVSVKTYSNLKSLGVYGDTLEDIIDKCIAAYRRVNAKEEVE